MKDSLMKTVHSAMPFVELQELDDLYEIVKTVANQLENANGEDIKGES
jgi:hypothetical protein